MNKEDLALLGDFIETGKVRPVIERTCKLSEAPEAIRISNKATLAAKQ